MLVGYFMYTKVGALLRFSTFFFRPLLLQIFAKIFFSLNTMFRLKNFAQCTRLTILHITFDPKGYDFLLQLVIIINDCGMYEVIFGFVKITTKFHGTRSKRIKLHLSVRKLCFNTCRSKFQRKKKQRTKTFQNLKTQTHCSILIQLINVKINECQCDVIYSIIR